MVGITRAKKKLTFISLEDENPEILEFINQYLISIASIKTIIRQLNKLGFSTVKILDRKELEKFFLYFYCGREKSC